MGKLKTKISFIERCVYFLDLRAYERRLDAIIAEKESRIAYLEEMLIDNYSGNPNVIIQGKISQEVQFLKAKRANSIESLYQLLKN